MRLSTSCQGWNLLGNLLDLGQIAFAPATPQVLRFAAHMEASHEFFSEYFHGVFATEVQLRTEVRIAGFSMHDYRIFSILKPGLHAGWALFPWARS